MLGTPISTKIKAQMKKYLIVLLLSGCTANPDTVPLGSYLFEATQDTASTCPANRSEIKYVFSIESEDTISIHFTKPQILVGTIASDSFDVSGENVLSSEQTISFTSESIQDEVANNTSSYNFNPFCFTSFTGSFVKVD